MWAGVVPQQPPTMLTRPACANSPSTRARSSGDSSYSPKAFGRPAFGWVETNVSAIRASSATYGRRSAAPSAQFRPTAIGRAWRTEFQNASVTWPDSVRPEASVIVPEMITGQRRPCSSKSVSTAKIDARALSVSKIVSMINASAPPSTQALRLLEVGPDELVEGDVAGAGVVDVRRDRRGPVGRARSRPAPSAAARVARLGRVAGPPGDLRGGEVDLVRQVAHAVVGERDALRVEGVRLEQARRPRRGTRCAAARSAPAG